MKKTTDKHRMSREQFLRRSLDAVVNKGQAKLRIHELVKQLGVTRGSFYWHFKDRDDFVRALVDYYHRWSTDQVIIESERIGGDAAQRIKTLMRVVAEEDLGRYENTMLSWGVQEPFVAKSFETAIRRRVEYVRALFLQLGFEGQELETRTLAFVGYMRMIFSAEDQDVRDDHLRHIEERCAVLMGK